MESESVLPAMAMDSMSQKIIYAKDTKIQEINLETLKNADNKDGEILPASSKEIGTASFIPKKILYSSKSRFVAIQGASEYMIYTSEPFQSTTCGESEDFAWSCNNDFAIQEDTGYVKMYTNFKEKGDFKVKYKASGIFGGQLLSSKNDITLSFYDWETAALVRIVGDPPRLLFWSENKKLMCQATEHYFTIMKYEAEYHYITDGPFSYVSQFPEVISSGIWIGERFVYTTRNAIKYYVDEKIYHVTSLPRPMYVIGYLTEENKIYLTDKDCNIVKYTLCRSLLHYKNYCSII